MKYCFPRYAYHFTTRNRLRFQFTNFWFPILNIITWAAPSRQILVPRKSRVCLSPTFPGRPIKILFEHHGEVPIWHPEMTSKGCLNLTFKGCSWEVDSGRPQDVHRTSCKRSSKHWHLDVTKFISAFLSELIRLT